MKDSIRLKATNVSPHLRRQKTIYLKNDNWVSIAKIALTSLLDPIFAAISCADICTDYCPPNIVFSRNS